MANLLDDDMKRNSKKITWSKLFLIITGLIFLVCILFVLYIYASGSIGNAFDTTVLGTIVTVSGAIFGSNLCWYSKKAASENHYKLRMSLYSDSAKIRLQYNEEMFKLMKKYKLRESDLEKVDMTGSSDEMMDSALDSVVTDLDNTRDSADAENTVETFTL